MDTPQYPQFFTATILQWKHLLKDDKCKQIVLNSMKFLVEAKRVTIYSFVIMPNHIHLIWQIHKGDSLSKVQQSFLKYTAQQIKSYLAEKNPTLLEECRVDAADRAYQIWERNPLSIDLFSHPVLMQKLDYIHNNPVQAKWLLAELPEGYRWSSAGFYLTGNYNFGFLQHYAHGYKETG